MAKKIICFVHGVGNQHPGFSKPLSTLVAQQTNTTCIEHLWQHQIDELPHAIKKAQGFRNLCGEIILDFAYVVLNYKTLTEQLPEADMYVGHSAGSIIIAEKTHKVLLGSPLELFRKSIISSQIKSLSNTSITKSIHTTLNIFNPYDPIAFELANAQNKTLQLKWYQDAYYRINPYAAHTNYWDNHSIATDISKWFSRIS